MKGRSDALSFPLPWAGTADTSFLKTPAETRALVETAGFRVTAERSLQGFAQAFFRDVLRKAAETGPPPLGLHLLTGANSPEKFRNYALGLEAQALDPTIMIAVRT
jgi:hypothetical protein